LFLFADMLVIAKTKGQKYDAVSIIPAPNLLIMEEGDSSMWLREREREREREMWHGF
jgi:hypothetical protein